MFDVHVHIHHSADLSATEQRMSGLESQIAALKAEVDGLKADAAAEKEQVDAKLADLQSKLESGSISLSESIDEIKSVRSVIQGFVPDEPAAPAE